MKQEPGFGGASYTIRLDESILQLPNLYVANFVQEICPCVLSSRTRNLDELEHCSILYKKPGSHVLEMLCFCLILSFNADKTIFAATAKSSPPLSTKFLVSNIRKQWYRQRHILKQTKRRFFNDHVR